MSKAMSKFTTVGRQKLEASLVEIFGEICTAQYCLMKVRPKVRTFLLKVAAGESIHPEIVRMQLGYVLLLWRGGALRNIDIEGCAQLISQTISLTVILSLVVRKGGLEKHGPPKLFITYLSYDLS